MRRAMTAPRYCDDAVVLCSALCAAGRSALLCAEGHAIRAQQHIERASSASHR